MSGLCAIPAGIQLVALFFLPESPRQLIVKNRLAAAKKALCKIYPYETPEELDAKMAAIQTDARDQANLLASQPVWTRFKQMLRDGPNRRALIIACALQLTQQWSGFNTLMVSVKKVQLMQNIADIVVSLSSQYYSATLFANIGFK